MQEIKLRLGKESKQLVKHNININNYLTNQYKFPKNICYY